jgi:ABC-type proline/glycine betaine transport system permease subunit
MLKNVVEPGRPQMTIWRMRIASYILKATNTLSGYVIRITFPLQQWLRERASVLRSTYVACLFESIIRINFTLQELPIYVSFTLLSSLFFLKECCHVLISAFDFLQNVSCNDASPWRDRIQTVSYILFLRVLCVLCPIVCVDSGFGWAAKSCLVWKEAALFILYFV